ncbi:hypothetical protein [Microlunatus sp. Y2014]|uniref:hypothetical protein n=1 Tax=Microlunatus sp. Y2014 TaxID=3418488 RepID=UPI003B4843E2
MAMFLAVITSCTTGAPEHPSEPTLPAPVPSITGAVMLGCSDTVSLSARDHETPQLTVSQVVFTMIDAAGHGDAYATTGSPPVKDTQRFGYFAKTPILLPAEADWVTIEVVRTGGTEAWTAWVPAAVWTTGSEGSWRLDDYAGDALVITLDRCRSTLGTRGLLGGLVMDRTGCFDVVVRTSTHPRGERRTVSYGEDGCPGT